MDRASVTSKFITPDEKPLRSAAPPHKQARKTLRVPDSAKVRTVEWRPALTSGMRLTAAEKMADLKISA
eukprot:6008603-Karenia_brevis.AAC.1